MFSKQHFLKHRILYSIFLASFALVLGGTLWAYFALRLSSGPVIIHFNALSGINLIGSFWSIVGFGATGLVMIAANFFIALELEERDGFMGKLVAAETVLLAGLIFVALAAIISVN